MTDRYNQLGNPTQSGNDIETSCRDDDGAVGKEPRFACGLPGCGTAIMLPRYIFCLEHWRQLPLEIQVTLWEDWLPGQEAKPSSASAIWLVAKENAIVLLCGGDPTAEPAD